MSCPKCGKKLESLDQKFCRYCGAELNIDAGDSHLQNSYKNIEAPREYSKIFFALATVSIVLGLLSISIGLPIFFYIGSSVKLEHGLSDLAYFNFCLEGDFCFGIPEPYYILEGELKQGAYVFGLLLIIFGIIGSLLGIIAIKIRRKARYEKKGKKLRKIGFIFGIVGIALSILGILIGGILLYIPSYIAEYNRFLNQGLTGW
jgi:MFS family permease